MTSQRLDSDCASSLRWYNYREILTPTAYRYMLPSCCGFLQFYQCSSSFVSVAYNDGLVFGAWFVYCACVIKSLRERCGRPPCLSDLSQWSHSNNWLEKIHLYLEASSSDRTETSKTATTVWHLNLFVYKTGNQNSRAPPPFQPWPGLEEAVTANSWSERFPAPGDCYRRQSL